MDEAALQEADAHLARARAARRRVELGAHARHVDAAAAAVERLSDGAERERLAWAVEAERLRDIGYHAVEDDELRRAEARAAEGLTSIGRDAPDVAARLHLALGQVHARLHPQGWEARAAERYRAAARHFIDATEHDDAAAALATLAWTVQLAVGTLGEARESLTEAVTIAEDPAMRAAMLSQRARVNLWLGDVSAAMDDIEIAWPLAEERGDDRSVAYVAWAAAVVASIRGQRAALATWIARGDARRGSWADDNVTGLWYDASVVEALARVGARDEARARLDRLLPFREHEPTAVGLAELAVEARWGDPAAADALWQDVRGRPDLEPWDAARMLLLLAATDPDPDGVASRAAQAFDLCAAFEDPAFLLTFEPDVAVELAPVAAAAGSRVAAGVVRARLSWRVHLLGAGEVLAPDGRRVDLTGRARRLVRLLAAHARPMGRTEVAQWLWPEGADDEWRRGRLRRLLHRTRAQAPELVETAPGDRLRLGDRVVVDVDRLLEAATDARRARDPVIRVARAREALSHAAGDVAPPGTLVDEDWLRAVRTRVSRERTWLHTTVAEHEADEGNAEVALLHARQALEAAATNEAAAVLAADLLRRAGRRGEAARVLDDVATALTELDLAPGPALLAARERLQQP